MSEHTSGAAPQVAIDSHRETKPSQRPRRRVQRAILAAAASIVVLALAGLPLYVFPPTDAAATADVAFVIGPPTEQRIDLAEDLARAGLVETILISVPRAGAQSADELSVCGRSDVACLTPEPMTTKGEVAMLGDFTREHPVERVIVITFAPHVTRTRFVLAKCFDGEATVIAVPQQLRLEQWAYQYLYQSAAFVKAAVTPCGADAGR